MATLKDIARIANVNISTVSKALRNSGDLNPQTISAIQAIADELQYPYAGESGKMRSLPLVGVVFPEIVSTYYADVIDSLRKHLLKDGYRMLLMLSGFSEDEEINCLQQLLRNNVCAVVCFSEQAEHSERFREIAMRQSVVFLMVTIAEDMGFCDSICIDDWQSAVLASEHLVSLGHRRIAYVGDTLSATRRKAFEETMAAHDLPVEDGFIIESNLRFEECGYIGMRTLLEMPRRPTAVFTAYDNIAIGAMRAIFEAGLTIPDDISVASIDDIRVVNYLNVRLTTVTEPTQDLGELAADLLTMKIKGKRKIIQNIKLKPTLNVRETTAPPPPEAALK